MLEKWGRQNVFAQFPPQSSLPEPEILNSQDYFRNCIMPLSESEANAVLPVLERVPIFSSLKKSQLKKIAQASVIRSFDSQENIAKEGDTGVAIYLILEGEVEVRRAKKSLAKLGQGQFFGELAVIDTRPRAADVVALDKTKCLILNSWTFDGLIKSNSDIATAMLKEMARRLRETNQSISG
jgi:CRP/FNR family cyclic AMP-dependent transcriptional regulator